LAQDKKATWKNLDRLWRRPDMLALDIDENKYVVFSDMHLGNGGGADDFCRNVGAMQRALDYYRENGYKLILLGDIEEFWQFGLKEIRQQYADTIYKKIKAFGDENVYRVWGNHDSEWGGLEDPARNQPRIFATAAEALKMKDKDGHQCILLLHGHQGSTESDKSAWLVRHFVRVWRYIKPLFKELGLWYYPSATKSQVSRDYERIFYSWAKKNKAIIICGHSHRAIFASESYMEILLARMRTALAVILRITSTVSAILSGLFMISKSLWYWWEELLRKRRIVPMDRKGYLKPCYFNAGCALYKDGITAIEIADDEICLVEWKREVKDGKEKEEFHTGKLSGFIDKVREG